MKPDPNYDFPEDRFPSEMEEIKSGEIFEIPEGYFQELEKKVFTQTVDVESDIISEPDTSRSVIRPLVWIASAAAAVLLILFIGDFSQNPEPGELNNISDLEIIEYLNDSDLDIDEILETMGEENISAIGTGADNGDEYFNYINENISEFEELLY